MKKRIISGLAAFALAAAGLGFTSLTQAKAAGLPTVRIVTPVFNPANDTFAADNLGQYYAAGGRSYYMYVGAGSTITLTYAVTSDGTTPAAGKTVNLQVNAPYSGSKAAWTVGGKMAGPSTDSGTGYGLQVSGVTDANGNVSFTIVNTDSAANAEALPASETAPRAASGRLYGNIKAVIDGLTDMQQVEDLLTFDITKAAASTIPAAATTPMPTPTPTATPTPTPKPTVAAGLNVRLVTPVLTDTNSIHRADLEKLFSVDNTWYAVGVGFRQIYLPTGSKFTVAYKVTDSMGAPVAGKTVLLHVNKAYSKSNATITDGKNTTDSKKDDSQGNDQLQLSATTDSKGIATFNLQNTNTKGEAVPATPLTPTPTDPTKGALFSQIYPEVNGATDIADFLEIHFTTAPAPVVAKTTITCVKGKISTKVTGVKPVCPKGYTKK